MPRQNFKNPDASAFNADEIAAMFDSIAARYDMMNRLLSLGRDSYWRQAAAKRLRASEPKDLLDIATGTADLLISCLRHNSSISRAVGVDISEKMLKIAEKKLKNGNFNSRSELVCASASRLPMQSNSFDAVVAGFGVRNFSDVAAAVSEIWRVLRPGGNFVVIEFATPNSKLLRSLFNFYMGTVAPSLASLLSMNKNAYKYLNSSIKLFGFPEKFVDVLKFCDFCDIKVEKLNFGSVCLCTASKIQKY